ncbi:Sugar phosphate isomerase/epimerase [Actinopolyspora alba]|uniref:Sugar phosphate isomerase/epimerase n=1 Tax=Actinopolyspora alba TaxID=673379 RepID=A0A1I2AH81_9ACTN|nr:sugar phosphate isomerase/epimerase family protein [Actinopolyspora alba]SFE42190.1 Sugar phosphate isomerase/epimerase [Actinopolyspora alba]
MSWKFAVSTLGMPGTPVRQAARVAREHGCHGVELRVHPDEEVRLGMSSRKAADTRRLIEGEGLEVACLAGYAKVCAPGPDESPVAELRSLVELAGLIGAPAVRVFPGGESGEDGPARERIGAVLPDLERQGVTLLVETHDSHPTGGLARRLVEPFGSPETVAVLWDALHPWRMGESPTETRELLGDYLGYFQIKDARRADSWTPVPPGEGDVPLAECGTLLRPWSGWISLEWERAWYPDIDPVPVPLRAAADWFERWHRPE